MDGLVKAERVGYRRVAGLDGALPLCLVQRVPAVLRIGEVCAASLVRKLDRVTSPESDVVRRWARCRLVQSCRGRRAGPTRKSQGALNV